MSYAHYTIYSSSKKCNVISLCDDVDASIIFQNNIKSGENYSRIISFTCHIRSRGKTQQLRCQSMSSLVLALAQPRAKPSGHQETLATAMSSEIDLACNIIDCACSLT